MNTNPNPGVLERAVEHLSPIADAMDFLGGCGTGCLLTDDRGSGHPASQARVPLVLERMTAISEIR